MLKCLIQGIHGNDYIELQTQRKIPNSQYRRLENDYEKIQREFSTYLNGYIKAVKKKRSEKEPLYRESSLVNFQEELGLTSIKGI